MQKSRFFPIHVWTAITLPALTAASGCGEKNDGGLTTDREMLNIDISDAEAAEPEAAVLNPDVLMCYFAALPPDGLDE